ncbi:MAG: AMP nucleosidase [Parvularculaceae bacterium]
MAAPNKMETVATPQEAVDRLEQIYARNAERLRAAVEAFLDGGLAPAAEMRREGAFVYPQLEIAYLPERPTPKIARAYGKFADPGIYRATIARPRFFENYLIEQLSLLKSDFDCAIRVGPSETEIPYAYVLEDGELASRASGRTMDLALAFPAPDLVNIDDAVANGLACPGEAKSLALFAADRTDYSLQRLKHYCGAHFSHFQDFILFTNYHRYVDEFVSYSLNELKKGGRYGALVLPGETVIDQGTAKTADAAALVDGAPWRRYQMPAYHLTAPGRSGITLVNIGVGPSNAKTITDHLAVLRPHCWMMIGHCGGLRQSQRLGDYVLAHAYLRDDHVLDADLPPWAPVPPIAEIQIALTGAVSRVTGDAGAALKQRVRTGTVVTKDDRNWELRYAEEARRFNQSRAIAVDMESATIAANGFRFRIPYGTLLCVSDKPLHGEIKLPGFADAFYKRSISEHIRIGIAAIDIIREQGVAALHSRKLRSFDEPPFR